MQGQHALYLSWFSFIRFRLHAGWCFAHWLFDYRTGFFFFFQAEDGIRDDLVTGVQTCALPIWSDSADSAIDAKGGGAIAEPRRRRFGPIGSCDRTGPGASDHTGTFAACARGSKADPTITEHAGDVSPGQKPADGDRDVGLGLGGARGRCVHRQSGLTEQRQGPRGGSESGGDQENREPKQFARRRDGPGAEYG